MPTRIRPIPPRTSKRLALKREKCAPLPAGIESIVECMSPVCYRIWRWPETFRKERSGLRSHQLETKLQRQLNLPRVEQRARRAYLARWIYLWTANSADQGNQLVSPE